MCVGWKKSCVFLVLCHCSRFVMLSLPNASFNACLSWPQMLRVLWHVLFFKCHGFVALVPCPPLFIPFCLSNLIFCCATEHAWLNKFHIVLFIVICFASLLGKVKWLCFDQFVGQRDLLMMQQFSSMEIAKPWLVMLAVVVNLFGVFHDVDSAALQAAHKCAPASPGMRAVSAAPPTQSIPSWS